MQCAVVLPCLTGSFDFQLELLAQEQQFEHLAACSEVVALTMPCLPGPSDTRVTTCGCILATTSRLDKRRRSVAGREWTHLQFGHSAMTRQLHCSGNETPLQPGLLKSIFASRLLAKICDSDLIPCSVRFCQLSGPAGRLHAMSTLNSEHLTSCG